MNYYTTIQQCPHVCHRKINTCDYVEMVGLRLQQLLTWPNNSCSS